MEEVDKMKKKISLLLVVIMLLTSLTQTAFADINDEEKFNSDIEFMKNVIYFVLDQYQYDVNQDDIINGLYDGFFSVLDEYSVYYTPEEYESMITDTAGEFTGIGVQIIEKDGHVVVVTPLPDSPAIEVGIKPGDIIQLVDDMDITGYTVDKASSIIRGDEGTKVKIGVIRDGKNLSF